MTSIPSVSPVRGARFSGAWTDWTWGIFLFIPLLLLTALGVRGIAASRRNALENAKADAARAIEYATRLFEVDFAAVRSSARTVALYALVPQPTETPQAEAL